MLPKTTEPSVATKNGVGEDDDEAFEEPTEVASMLTNIEVPTVRAELTPRSIGGIICTFKFFNSDSAANGDAVEGERG